MPFLRKYNTLTVTGTTAIRIPIIKRAVVDNAVGADWTPAAGDVKIAIDGAVAANVTNLPTAVAMGNTAYWEFILTAAELTCKSAVITVADSATKAVEDQTFVVETFGHASAMYTVDFQDAVRFGLSALPAALPGAANGALIAGSNAATTFATLTSTGAFSINGTSMVAQTGDCYPKLDTEIAAILAAVDTEIGAIQTTLGTPAGASLAADLLVIDNFVDDLETRLTAARAGYLDNLSAGAVALAATALSTANWTSARAGYLDNINNADLQNVDVSGTGAIKANMEEICGTPNGESGDLSHSANNFFQFFHNNEAASSAVVSSINATISSRASQASVDTIDDFLDTEMAATLAAVDTEVAAIQTAVVTTIPATLAGLFTTALTESYRTDGATGTVAQILYELIGHHNESNISSVTKTVKKIDGSTTAFTLTLNDATTPTAITRAT